MLGIQPLTLIIIDISLVLICKFLAINSSWMTKSFYKNIIFSYHFIFIFELNRYFLLLIKLVLWYLSFCSFGFGATAGCSQVLFQFLNSWITPVDAQGYYLWCWESTQQGCVHKKCLATVLSSGLGIYILIRF